VSNPTTIKVYKIGSLFGLNLFETEKGDAVYGMDGDKQIGVAWGPAADGTDNWFVKRTGKDAIRLDNRFAALQYMANSRLEDGAR
jgi:hypothetical protein